MITSRRTTAAAALASGAAIAMVVSGCSTSGADDGNPPSTANPITLTITTFGTMGLDGLYQQYEDTHPGITIKATNIDTGDNARTDAFTKIGAGTGLPDVQAIEEGWVGAIRQVSDQFVDLRDYGAEDIIDQWLPWKAAEATDDDGRVFGYGLDVGPEGLCYNGKLFAAAGLPSDRDAVAELFGGDDATWQKFFEIGKQYHQATGKAFYDQSGFVWNAMVNELPEGYYTKDGKLNVKDNAQLKALWDLLADAAASGLSDNQTQWDWGGGKAFTDGSFATFVCPSWMLGVVKGQVEAGGGDSSTGWDFANVFPGGAANWGGSWLTVPKQSKHPKEAAELAQWLSAGPQQIAAFKAAGPFPSNIEAQKDPGVTAASDMTKFFNDAPIGEILAKRAAGVVAQYKGPDDSIIQSQVFGPSIIALDGGKVDGAKGWSDAMALLDQLVVNK